MQIFQIERICTLPLLQLSHTYSLKAFYFTSGNVSTVGKRVGFGCSGLGFQAWLLLNTPLSVFHLSSSLLICKVGRIIIPSAPELGSWKLCRSWRAGDRMNVRG